MLYVAGATVLLASLIAMTKDNLKARLAYSTVSQLGYIVMGAALAHQLGIIGGAMHIATHAFGKITLFFAAGAILVASHKTEISQMRGLGRAMPFTFAAMLIGCISIIGLPPMGGTWSKWYLVMATVETEQWVMLAILLISSLLNIAYLLPIPIRAFYGTADGASTTSGSAEAVKINEAPLFCLLAMAISASGCVLLFFYPQPLYELVSALFTG
jgi:multicomponent Na+:H+ antiporter subunit D